jgi:hypothetical protein
MHRKSKSDCEYEYEYEYEYEKEEQQEKKWNQLKEYIADERNEILAEIRPISPRYNHQSQGIDLPYISRSVIYPFVSPNQIRI